MDLVFFFSLLLNYSLLTRLLYYFKIFSTFTAELFALLNYFLLFLFYFLPKLNYSLLLRFFLYFFSWRVILHE